VGEWMLLEHESGMGSNERKNFEGGGVWKKSTQSIRIICLQLLAQSMLYKTYENA
jgi:hypothetical protein